MVQTYRQRIEAVKGVKAMLTEDDSIPFFCLQKLNKSILCDFNHECPDKFQSVLRDTNPET
jgi:hypothetical protein